MATNEGVKEYFECQCQCHTDNKFFHEGHCCFMCPKCKRNIMLHFFNEHRHTCRGVRPLKKPKPKVTRTVIEKPKPKIRKASFGSTRTRHRRRKPVGR